MFKDVNEAISYIENIKRTGRRENLDRMKKALKLLGNPEQFYRKIHVAGTNGKGSTVSYLTKLLISSGYKVGSFVSPYVVKFNERIEINENYISDSDIIKYSNIVKKVADKIYEEDKDVVTFFEFLTLLGFLYFKEMNIDFAVIEVGMGGILDATNVIDADISIITNIGFDHMTVLGDTLEQIADKKLGIVKKDNILVTSVDDSLREYFKSKLEGVTSQIYFVDPTDIKTDLTGTSFTFENSQYFTPLIGLFQAKNAALAIKAYQLLFKNYLININEVFREIKWPGRLEVISRNPLILIDGGHNIHGVSYVVSSLKTIEKSKKFNIIFTALKDKETKKMIGKLEEIAKFFIFTEIDDIRKKDANDLALECNIPCKIIRNYQEAIEEGIKITQKNEVLLITGSLHFISMVIKYFNN